MRLHGDPSIIGKTLRLDRENWTVIGVAARGFEHVGGDYRSPLQGDTVAIWRPLPVEITPANADCMKGCHYTNAIARFAPGVTERDDLDRILNELARRFPDFYKDKRVRVEPLSTEVVGQSRSAVLIILAAGTLVLLLSSINVAGLSIARVLIDGLEIERAHRVHAQFRYGCCFDRPRMRRRKPWCPEERSRVRSYPAERGPYLRERLRVAQCDVFMDWVRQHMGISE